MYKILWIKVCMCVHVILCIQNSQKFCNVLPTIVCSACMCACRPGISNYGKVFFFLFFGVRRPEVSVFSHTNVRSSSLMLCLLWKAHTHLCSAENVCKNSFSFFCKLGAFEYPYFHTFTWAALVCFLVHLCSAESVCKSFACIFFFELRCPEVSVLCLCAILPHPVFSSDAPLSIRIPTHLHIHTVLGALKCQYSVCVPVSLILLVFIPAFFSWVTHP